MLTLPDLGGIGVQTRPGRAEEQQLFPLRRGAVAAAAGGIGLAEAPLTGRRESGLSLATPPPLLDVVGPASSSSPTHTQQPHRASLAVGGGGGAAAGQAWPPRTPLKTSRGTASSVGSERGPPATPPSRASPRPAGTAAGDGLGGLSGWAPVAYKANIEEGLVPGLLEDQKVLADLSSSMADQLNSMFAFMHQVVTRERAHHASNISLMMRKVDKDLKGTYDSVRHIFAGLTEQLLNLVKEVENSRKQVKSIQEKYQIAKEAAEAQSQYVLELEAVIDGQTSGVAETLRKLNDIAVGRAQEIQKLGQEHRQREQKLRQEIARLKEEQKRHAETEKKMFQEGGTHPLPEMTASWTRRAETAPGGSRRDLAEDKVDIVGSVLSHCDSVRAAPRAKRVRMPQVSPRGDLARGGLVHLKSNPDPERLKKQVAALRRRAEQAEARVERLHGLVTFASSSLLLLRDVFSELRASRYLAATEAGPAEHSSKHLAPDPHANEVLARVVKLFQAQVPKLGGLGEVVRALAEEAAHGPPQRGGMRAEDASSCSGAD